MTQNGDYGRTDVMAKAQRRVHELAGEGLSVGEIETRLNGSLTRTEQELMRVCARSEVAAARRGRVAESLEPGSGWVARQETRSMPAPDQEEKIA